MNKPFFSVIIPTYNREKFLKIAVRSVLEQTLDDYELIIVDDGSTDNTRKMCEGLDARIKYIYQENKGPAAARNRGIQESKGAFICFLDTDDRYRPNKLEVTYQYINAYPGYHIFHTEELWYRRGELLSQKVYHKKPTGFVFENAVKLCSISISTAAIKREIFEEAGLFDESFPACEDYDFWLRLTYRWPVMLIPHYLTIKEGGHKDQQSVQYPAMDTFRIRALKKILEAGVLNEKDYAVAFAELKKKCDIFIKGAVKRNKTAQIATYRSLIAKLERSHNV
jgi:glycosyltransferase involved in cell wall biosynthesis